MSKDKPSKGLLSAVSKQDYEQVACLLGRKPRGLRGVALRTNDGGPVVIQVDSLVDGKPFPTLFWLVDQRLNYAIDQLEAGGLIADFQAQVDASAQLQAAMASDHQAYLDLRGSLTPPEQQLAIQQLGFDPVLARRGIGGIENFTRIRCLHTYYAAHLVIPNTIGTLLDAHWQAHNVIFCHIANDHLHY